MYRCCMLRAVSNCQQKASQERTMRRSSDCRCLNVVHAHAHSFARVVLLRSYMRAEALKVELRKATRQRLVFCRQQTCGDGAARLVPRIPSAALVEAGPGRVLQVAPAASSIASSAWDRKRSRTWYLLSGCQMPRIQQGHAL